MLKKVLETFIFRPCINHKNLIPSEKLIPDTLFIIKVVRNCKMLAVGRLRHTFSTHHNLNYNCLITKK